MVRLLASGPSCPNSQLCRKFSGEKLSLLLRLINSAGWRKVDSGLKMLIKPSSNGYLQASTTKTSLPNCNLINNSDLCESSDDMEMSEKI